MTFGRTKRIVAAVASATVVAGALTISLGVIDGGAVSPTVTATALSPAFGPTSGGNVVTITGTGLTAATGVTFGGTATQSFSKVSATELQAQVPAGTAGAAAVVVIAGNSSAADSQSYTYVAPPTIGGLTPQTGPTAGGTPVTITGTGFSTTDPTTVFFGTGSSDIATASNVVVVSSTTITAITPARPAGQDLVAVSDDGGAALASQTFTYAATAPVVSATGLSPAFGSTTGGNVVTITGTGLSGTTGVSFGANAVQSFAKVSDTQLQVQVPAGSAGVATVVVTAGGTQATDTQSYTYVAAPTVTSVSPVTGLAAGGTTITITGTGFVPGDPTTVLLGTSATSAAAATNVVVVNATTITAVTPARPAGADIVTVSDDGGSVVAPQNFTYVATSATGLSPAFGSTTGGNVVTITGTGLSGTTGVSFGANAVQSFANVSDTQLQVQVPAGSAGVVSVVITAGGNQITDTQSYTYVAAPTVTSVSPVTGPAAGGTAITITGTGFSTTDPTTVLLGTGTTSAAAATNVVVVNATTITAVTPARPAGTDIVTVSDDGGSVVAPQSFTYVAATPLTATGISPAFGSTIGSNLVTITGTGLSGTTGVSFGANPVQSFAKVSDTQLEVQVPAGSAGVVSVVITAGSAQTTDTQSYTYVAAPTVTSVSPVTGSTAGGTAITITGTGFVPGDPTTVLVGTSTTSAAAATNVVVVNATTITAVTPARPAGVDIVTVSDDGGSVVAPQTFTYVGTSATGLSPAFGSTTGGNVVTITGTGLSGTTGVSFGANPVQSFAKVSDTQLQVQVPAGSAGKVAVVVTLGGTQVTDTQKYTYVGSPVINSIKPVKGPAAGGTGITIKGIGFVPGDPTSVTIGTGTSSAAAATDVTVVNSTTITAVTPARPAGADYVVVTDDGGSALAPQFFTYK